MNANETTATQTGQSDGFDHANYVDNYGGDLHATPEVPTRFADVATCYTAGFAEGVEQYQEPDDA